MKSVLICLVLALCVSQALAQKELTRTTTDAPGGTMTAAKGYPPKGYPCLGCVPCPGNSKEFCDVENNKADAASREMVAFKPHPQALELGYVYADSKMIPIASFVARPDIKSSLTELGFDFGAAASKPVYPTSVECGCGSDVWGKDRAACQRICAFLKQYGQ